MGFYRCPVCNMSMFNTPYYCTDEGQVCEECYEGGDFTRMLEEEVNHETRRLRNTATDG